MFSFPPSETDRAQTAHDPNRAAVSRRIVVTMLLHSTHVLVRFGAQNVFLTVTWKKCIITFIHAVKTHIYAGGRKPLIWLRPPPSAPSLKTACVKSNAGAWALQRRWRGEISRPRQVEIARPHFHEPALPPKSSERICWPINFTLRGMDRQTPGLQFACQPFEANR